MNSKSKFVPASNRDTMHSFFKAAFEGEPGTGKSWTAALVAIGLHKKIGSKKPIVLIDTEKASKFLVPLFQEHGIEAMVRETHSLASCRSHSTRTTRRT